MPLSFFVGDLNGNHWDWFGSTTANHHGIAAFDTATASGCSKLVIGQSHAHGGTLDLLITDVPDQVWVAVVSPIGNSDHSPAVGGHFDGSGCLKLVCQSEIF